MDGDVAYTLHGSEALEARIGSDLAELVRRIRQAHSDLGFRDLGLAAIYLGGGYGRGEGGVRRLPDGTERPYNDYDLFVVTRGLPRWLSRWERRGLRTLAERATEDLGVEVEFGHLRAEDLPNSPFTLMRTDFRHGARRLWGSFDATAAMPPLPPGLLPLREATLLLVNRGALLVMLGCDGVPRTDERYSRYVRKAFLAMGDATLIADGVYDPSWQRRARLVQSLALPVELRETYAAVVRARLHGERGELPALLPGGPLLAVLAKVEAKRRGGGSALDAHALALRPAAELPRGYGALVPQLASLLSEAERSDGPWGAALRRRGAEFLRQWRRAA